jgi:carbonic anhydrase/acetyltransferase-like protein (isoleucine patch superfamily)
VWPRIAASAWLAPGAAVVGDVEIGPDSSVWYGATLRGDVNAIRVGARSNLQDQCVVHVTRDRFGCDIGDEVTVGHRAVVHGCTIGDGALVGIGAIVLDGARVGEGSLVAAGALVAPGFAVPDGALVVGVPARVSRRLDEGERALQRRRALEYVETAREHASLEAP